MRKTSILLAISVLLAGGLALGQSPPLSSQDSPDRELAEMYETDQRYRENFSSLSAEERLEMQATDRRHLLRVLEILRTQELKSADGFYHAAMILQHSAPGRDGYSPFHYLLAHTLSTLAGVEKPERARWLSAAALDRYFFWTERDQFFGTQFVRDAEGNWQPGPFNPRLTKELESVYHLPSRVEATAAANCEPENPAAEEPELASLSQADQDERKKDWSRLKPEELVGIVARDRQRRERVLELLGAGRVRTAADYYHAALILQHGDTAEDYLLAHALSTAAAFLGHPEALWLSAATLDRYLVEVGEHQLFGTQFYSPDGSQVSFDFSAPVDPLLPDFVRKRFIGRTYAETVQQLEELKKGGLN